MIKDAGDVAPYQQRQHLTSARTSVTELLEKNALKQFSKTFPQPCQRIMFLTQLLQTSHRTLPAHVAKRMQKLLLLIRVKSSPLDKCHPPRRSLPDVEANPQSVRQCAVALVHAGQTSPPRGFLQEIEESPQLPHRSAVALVHVGPTSPHQRSLPLLAEKSCCTLSRGTNLNCLFQNLRNWQLHRLDGLFQHLRHWRIGGLLRHAGLTPPLRRSLPQSAAS